MRILTFPAWSNEPKVTTPPLEKGYCGIAIGPDSAEGLVLCEGFPLQAGRILPLRERKYTIEHIRPTDPQRPTIVAVAAFVALTGTHHATLTWPVTGLIGNGKTITLVADGAGAGSLTVLGVGYTFHYANGVTTMANFVTAAAGVFVFSGHTPADVLAAPGDTQGPLTLAGGIAGVVGGHDPSLDCIQNLSVIVFEDPSEMGAHVMRPNLNFHSSNTVSSDVDRDRLALSIPFVGRRQCAITFHSENLVGNVFGFLVKGVRYQYSSRKVVKYDGPTAAAQALDANNTYSIDIGGMDNAELWDALEVHLFGATGKIDIDADTIGEIGAY